MCTRGNGSMDQRKAFECPDGERRAHGPECGPILDAPPAAEPSPAERSSSRPSLTLCVLLPRPRCAGRCRKRCGRAAKAALAAAAVAITAPSASAVESVPLGFELSTITEGLELPVAMAYAPDGRLFVAQLTGQIRVVQPDGMLDVAPFAEIDVFAENENGLLGLTLDPYFATNHYVYAFATITYERQQIIRFTDIGGAATDPVVIRDNLPTRGVFHAGGGLKFGPDGKLYFSIGDNSEPANAQDVQTLAGKICRINPDGTTPSDNPFITPTGTPRAIFALGFRNPFRFNFAPDGRLFALDVGSDGDMRREEINLVTAGGNYGWPLVEGRRDAVTYPDLLDPIYDYHDGGSSPVGLVYYDGAQFPLSYQGNLFHLEYTLNRLYRVRLDGDQVVSHDLFAELNKGPVDLAIAPDGALVYCELFGGRIRKLRYALTPVVSAEEVVDSDTVDPISPGGLCGGGVFYAGLGSALATCFPRRSKRTRGSGSFRVIG